MAGRGVLAPDTPEQSLARRLPAAHRTAIEVAGPFADRGVQFGEREQPPTAQPRQSPTLHHLHPDLGVGLIKHEDLGATVSVAPWDRATVW